MKRTRTFAWRLAVALVVSAVVAPLLAVGVELSERLPPSERAAEWASRNNGSLPTTLDGIASFPTAYRLAIFRASSPEAKAAIVREQFRRFAEQESLNAVQVDLVKGMIDVLTPSLYADIPKARATLGGLCARFKDAFPSREHRQALSTLGTYGKPNTSARAGLIRMREWLHRTFTVQAAEPPAPDCTCHVDSWCSCSSCRVPDGGCNTSDYGCGCGFAWQCNGKCNILNGLN
jgi:hypothetical protein